MAECWARLVGATADSTSKLDRDRRSARRWSGSHADQSTKAPYSGQSKSSADAIGPAAEANAVIHDIVIRELQARDDATGCGR